MWSHMRKKEYLTYKASISLHMTSFHWNTIHAWACELNGHRSPQKSKDHYIHEDILLALTSPNKTPKVISKVCFLPCLHNAGLGSSVCDSISPESKVPLTLNSPFTSSNRTREHNCDKKNSEIHNKIQPGPFNPRTKMKLKVRIKRLEAPQTFLFAPSASIHTLTHTLTHTQSSGSSALQPHTCCIQEHPENGKHRLTVSVTQILTHKATIFLWVLSNTPKSIKQIYI